MTSSVEFAQAGFSYHPAGADALAVRGVDLAIEPGQCAVLTGPSGCGKTTLLRMVNGLVPAVYEGDLTGDVRVCGRSVADWDMGELCATVGTVSQNPRSQFFNLDTTSEVAFGCENRGLAREEICGRVRRAVRDLGIESLLDRDVRELSGGQRQLVLLASACAMGPDVVVLDEPTASLDIESMRLLARGVARLKGMGKTILIAEHRLWWLDRIADRYVHVLGGRIEHDWTAREFAELSPQRMSELGLRVRSPGDVIRQRGARAAGAVRPDPVIGAEALDVGYASHLLVRGATLSLQAGRIYALVGRNGAGKTTFARCVAGLKRESGGRVFLEGKPAPRRKRLGRAYLVMQETGYQLFSDSVEGEVSDALAARGNASRRGAGEILESFGLADVAGRHPLSLSGGQRQRLAIACGIAQGSRALILDEPTSGLDFGNMARIASELARLRDEGRCIVVATHDFEFASLACDSVLRLEGGTMALSTDADVPGAFDLQLSSKE